MNPNPKRRQDSSESYTRDLPLQKQTFVCLKGNEQVSRKGSSGLLLYINGVAQGPAVNTALGPADTGEALFNIGARFDFTSQWAGDLCMLNIWSEVFDSDKVVALNNAGKGYLVSEM